jgi:hypothetical protein
METKTNPIVFFDSVGRTVIGEKLDADSNENILAVKNPAVVHISPNPQSGQLTLQILPLFFKEFLADKNSPTIWLYKKHSITESKDVVFDFKLQAQYQQLFADTPQPSQPQNSPDVVKLFDEE